MAESAVTGWYKEEKHYDYNNPGSHPEKNGHFTQVVWKASRKLGFGVAKVNGYSVAVAVYSPAGNLVGDYSENVLEP